MNNQSNNEISTMKELVAYLKMPEKSIYRLKKTMLLTLMLFALGVQPAFAYIDPGSGSAIMSAIIGFFVAIGVLVKTFWYKIKSFLGLSKNTKASAESDDNSK